MSNTSGSSSAFFRDKLNWAQAVRTKLNLQQEQAHTVIKVGRFSVIDLGV
jgi:hypothetical protein